jgi:ribose transport system ATP-binding protein
VRPAEIGDGEGVTDLAKTSDERPLLQMKGVTKRFPGVVALREVSFSARSGEVHALVGENGAGKSTLMKILAGVYRLDEGEIQLGGVSVQVEDPRAAQRHGIAIIHQELNQVPELKAFENFFLGRERRRAFRVLDEGAMRAETRRWLGQLGLDLDPDRKVGELRAAERQLLEIGKAMSLQARVLVMDEPTTALSIEEVGQLFTVVRRLRGAGMAIVYISHRLEEVFALSDRITVLRDGRRVDSRPVADFTRASLIQAMVGHEAGGALPARPRTVGAEVLGTRGLSVSGTADRSALHEIDLEVRAGQIVGLAGLLGSGRTELLEALFGVPHPRRVQGEVSVHGRPVRLASPRDAIRAGISFVTEDRKAQSLVLSRSVLENASLAALSLFRRRLLPVLDLRAEARAVEGMVSRLRIKTPTLRAAVAGLSGGNQQKVALAKFLLLRPALFLLDQPTQGVDVGAKAEIFALVDGLAREGAGVLLASSDLSELRTLCDQIYVLCEGRITGRLARHEATQERILDLATRFDRAHAGGRQEIVSP